MISRLEIKGFKSLVDVSIELGAVNVFIGANGSGKSNLLEAVGFLSAVISGGLEAESIRYRGVRLGNPFTFCSSLKASHSKSITIKVADDRSSYSADFAPNEKQSAKWTINQETIRHDGNEVFHRSNEGFFIQRPGDSIQFATKAEAQDRSLAKYASNIYGLFIKPNSDRINPSLFHDDKSIRETSDRVYSFLDQMDKYAIFSPSTPHLRGFLDDILREPLGLGWSGLSRAIDEMLTRDPEKLGPFDLDDVYELIEWADSLEVDAGHTAEESSGGNGRPVRVRIGDRFMGTGHKSVSLLEASEGALYVLFLLALVGHEQSPKIFAVDNFDQALHPRLALALTRLITEQIVDDGSRQMLATTHNPLVLDGLDILDDRIRLFTVDRDPRGATRVDRVMVTEELMAQADKGLSLSRLWVMGRFGGVPRNL